MTRKQSASLQGIAILLMIYHHLFLEKEIIWQALLSGEAVTTFAWFGKICVGMFAFITGYGMCRVGERFHTGSFGPDMGTRYRDAGNRILQLFVKYWFAVILYKLITMAMGTSDGDIGRFFLNFFAISFSYNGTWWYMQQYVQMLLLYPLLSALFSNYEGVENQKKWWVLSIVAGLFALPMVLLFLLQRELFLQILHFLRPSFTAVFVVGFILARYGIYEKLKPKQETPKSNIAMVGIGLLCMVLVFVIRTAVTHQAADARYDFLLVPVWVLGINLVLRQGRLPGALAYVGRYSTYMWLTHGFLAAMLQNLLAGVVKTVPGYYAIIVIISFVLAWIMERMEDYLCTFIRDVV